MIADGGLASPWGPVDLTEEGQYSSFDAITLFCIVGVVEKVMQNIIYSISQFNHILLRLGKSDSISLYYIKQVGLQEIKP